MRVLVVGIGNAWAGDDGIGPEIVRRLQANYATTAVVQRGEAVHLAFRIMPHPDVTLIETLADCDVLVIVDAVKSGAPPGTIHCQAWQPNVLSSRQVERSSSHGWGVREILGLAHTLECLPTKVILWGIEAAAVEPGAGLSPELVAALPDIVNRFDQILEECNSPFGTKPGI